MADTDPAGIPAAPAPGDEQTLDPIDDDGDGDVLTDPDLPVEGAPDDAAGPA